MNGNVYVSAETCDYVESVTLDAGTESQGVYENVYYFRNPEFIKAINGNLVMRTSKKVILDVSNIAPNLTPFEILVDITGNIISYYPRAEISLFWNEPFVKTSDPKNIHRVGISVKIR